MIFITGSARSGTSLTTGVIRDSGARLGDVNSLNEHLGVRERVLKPMIAAKGYDPVCQDMDRLPDPEEYRDVDGVALRNAILKEIGCSDNFCYKDAKLLYVWPAFERAFPEAPWVCTVRDSERVAESCVRTSFMRRYSSKDEWQEWADCNLKLIKKLSSSVPGCLVNVSKQLRSERPFSVLIEWLGLDYDPKKSLRSVDMSKWHG